MTPFTHLANYFFYRIKTFFHHWYIDSFFVFSHRYLEILGEFDQILAWRVTLKNIFQPLYKDYSVIGYVFGFIFRLIRLIVGALVYACLFVLGAALYLAWLLVPVYVIFRIFFS